MALDPMGLCRRVQIGAAFGRPQFDIAYYYKSVPNGCQYNFSPSDPRIASRRSAILF